jgi:hypothetical protein
MNEKWPVTSELTPWQRRILDQSDRYLQAVRTFNPSGRFPTGKEQIVDTASLTARGILQGIVQGGHHRLAGSRGGHAHDRACRSRGGNLYCPSPVEPDAVIDPRRPQPLTERERWSTWVLRFGKQQMEYELVDSPTGRGLATYAVGRVGPSFVVVGGSVWPR